MYLHLLCLLDCLQMQNCIHTRDMKLVMHLQQISGATCLAIKIEM